MRYGINQCLKVARMVWDRSSEIVREGTFLRLSVNDSYNMNMNNVDIADQLRNQYRPDKWMRKQKWWWSMFFWGHGTMLVNAYIAYKRFMEMNGKYPILHYEFQMNVILAKICPSQHSSQIQQQPFAVQRGDPNAVARSSNSICSKWSSSSSVASSSATRQSTKKMRNNYGTSKQIETAGSIMNQVRLNPNLCHLPIPNTCSGKDGTGGKCCTLCRWATGKKLSGGLL